MKDDWKVFANCRWNPENGEWEMMKRDIKYVYEEASDHELLGG